MHKFELSLERELDFMIKYGLTADELYLIRLIFLAQDGHEEYLNKFFKECSLGSPILALLTSLQQKGVINKSYTIPPQGTVFEPKDVEFNKQIIKGFLQHSEDMGMELFQAYPAMTVINGKTFSLRNIAKFYKSFDDFTFAYGKEIKFDPIKHQEILDILEWAKENNLVHSGLGDFIISRRWLDYQEMRDGGMGTFNTNELI